jgi:hypothetical protein
MNSEDMLLLAALRSLPHGERISHPIRLHRLSSAARATLDDLVKGLELRLGLLGMSTLGVRADLFGLLRIDASPEQTRIENNLHGAARATA